MRDRLSLPIEYDQLHFGFTYTQPVTGFPSIEVSEGEVIALFVAQKALEQYRGTSFEKPLRTAFEKISWACRTGSVFSGATWIQPSPSAAWARASRTSRCSRR